MSQYLLLNKVEVQNANAISGFTWGFPAITHFLGFSHNLARKLIKKEQYEDISLVGCTVIAHKHHVHSFQADNGINFSQNKTPHYLKPTKDKGRVKDPSVIEEGKMNMTVSLLIRLDGYLGNRQENFETWAGNTCLLQRLAGGVILNIGSVEVIDAGDINKFRSLKRKLLPGFILQDRSEYLENYYRDLSEKSDEIDILDAWLDFSALRQKARPNCDLIDKHFKLILDTNGDDSEQLSLVNLWLQHKKSSYQKDLIPTELLGYFGQIKTFKASTNLLKQWQSYVDPNETTDATWEYVSKPESGYLVPIVTGYKALTQPYEKSEVEGLRVREDDDSVDNVCFVESVHSIGEWQSIHRLKDVDALSNSLWNYVYRKDEPDWYLCKQGNNFTDLHNGNADEEVSDSDFQ